MTRFGGFPEDSELSQQSLPPEPVRQKASCRSAPQPVTRTRVTWSFGGGFLVMRGGVAWVGVGPEVLSS